MISLIKQAKHLNLLGVTASGLCLIHCLMTPLFFSLQASTFGLRNEHWSWWQMVDLVFLFISGIAVFVSASHTSKPWMKYALWVSWITLSCIILNEKFQVFRIVEAAIYVPSISLIVLHMYNHKYCKCADTNCCAHSSGS